MGVRTPLPPRPATALVKSGFKNKCRVRAGFGLKPGSAFKMSPVYNPDIRKYILALVCLRPFAFCLMCRNKRVLASMCCSRLRLRMAVIL